ncbi:SPOC domain-containing protein [Trichonephila inaurata madagascariensis]|uniref:SPOC domain-containing protein n=1 Tax=Trichonephila inaurata madagascariensis TaxID=2747483 RepID=A0A8X6YIV7_9ARAC|nr:SPOC domain-containing protein [Trichonephila inaurata madagascariensis]
MRPYKMKYPHIWSGQIIVKGQRAPMKLNYVEGNINVAVSALLRNRPIPYLKISRQVPPGYFPTFKTNKACLLTAQPQGNTLRERMIRIRSMRRIFSNYIKAKGSNIGLTLLPIGAGKRPLKAFVITPSEVTSRLLVRYAPDWYHSICDKLHFLVMISY